MGENTQNGVQLVTAEMDLGHIRAIKPIETVTKAETVVLGTTKNATARTKFIWRFSLAVYEFLSRVSQVPIIGSILFSPLNRLLQIKPLGDVSKKVLPSFQVSLLESAIKLGVGNEISSNGFLECNVYTSFYLPVSYFAMKGFRNKIFCQICDVDLNRVWVPRNPRNPNIHYIATTRKSVYRLESYGVGSENIHLFGFPLPHELVGGVGQEIAISNYAERTHFLTNGYIEGNRPLNVVFPLGGAGAMVRILEKVAESLLSEINNGIVKLTVIPGPHSVRDKRLEYFKKNYFEKTEGFQVVLSHNINDYFHKFNGLLKDAHVLFTKPSELTFYSSLGIPIIMTEPLGSQEQANREWLLANNIGVDMFNPSKSDIWLMNLLHSGTLARLAKNGWICGKRLALYEIQKLVSV